MRLSYFLSFQKILERSPILKATFRNVAFRMGRSGKICLESTIELARVKFKIKTYKNNLSLL